MRHERGEAKIDHLVKDWLRLVLIFHHQAWMTEADARECDLNAITSLGQRAAGGRRPLGFDSVIPEATGRPAYHPGALLTIHGYGYINQIASSRRLSS